MILFYPEISGRSCETCKQFVYDDGPHGMGAEPATTKDERRRPIPMVRPPGSPLPCQWCPKIERGQTPCPENAIEPTDQSRAAYQHFCEAKEVGFTDEERADRIVRRNAGIIGNLIRQRNRQPIQQLIGLVSLGVGRGG